MLALAVALTLTPPVPGAVARPFAYAGDPFARGHHRGVDLAARPGEPVRAACGGRVTFAGRAGANGGAVTIRCGRWSVTHLPLRGLAVRAGEQVSAGATLGATATARGHTGIHLGVRRTSDPLGYVDPAPLLRAPRRPAPPTGPQPTARRIARPPPHPAPLPSGPAGRPASAQTAPAQPASAQPAPAQPASAQPASAQPASAHPAPRPGSSPLAPWPAWAGLALLLSGAAGAGAVRVRRARRAAPTRAAAAPVR